MSILPPPGPTRRLCLQSGLYAVGSGTFLAGNAVYFTQVVGLTGPQVGLGLTVSSLVSLLFAVPLGRLADIVGHQRTWAVAAAAEAACYLLYPFIHGVPTFVTVIAVLACIEATGSGGRSGYTYNVVRGEGRTQSLAFVRTALNIGFTVGAGVAAIALAIGGVGLHCIPLMATLFMAINAVLITRLPQAPQLARPTGRMFGALRDVPFLAVMALTNGVGGMHGILAMTIIPLWLVTATTAPHSLTAWLFALNTVMAVGFQVLATRRIHDPSSAARAIRRSMIVLALACIVLFSTTGVPRIWAIGGLVLAMVLTTCAELWQSGGAWQLMGDLVPAERRGEYSGTATICRQAIQAGAPAAITWLTMSWQPAGWFVVAGVMLAAAMLVVPTMNWAVRTRDR